MAELVKKRGDMTVGSIPRHLITYALPILLGTVLQYLYSAVDAWVLGQSGQTAAYAAVGMVSSVTQLTVSLFWGFSLGSGILLSRAFGAKDEERVSRIAHTALSVTVLIGLFLTLLGTLVSPVIVRLVLGAEGDAEIYTHATTYVTIFFGGIVPMLVYNIGAEIMRAVGNSRYPALFLAVGSILNILLDLLFVFVFDLGVAGVAWATVVAQALAAVLVVGVLFSRHSPVRLSVRRLRIDGGITASIVRIGIPVAIQFSVTNLSAILMQSYVAGAVGATQEAILGGYTTYNKIYSLCSQPAAALQVAISVFAGQNIGAGQYKRARRGWLTTMAISCACVAPLYFSLFLFAPYLPYAFISAPAVVAVATRLFRTIPLLMIFSAVVAPTSGYLRAQGRTGSLMVASLSVEVGLRQLYLFLMASFISNDYLHIICVIPFGHIALGLILLLMCLYDSRRTLRGV